ncbi:F-box/kelch-repeat protein At3g23880 [Prunus persica]|uniref:F-box/kelch-repeat protein At3g23880 n=1 Tax=Prunus persica TaxID=3760 RepID=UPI0009AB9803|nr:F-box/kelch-repeat protein At3g23880 [Prunus persica]
MEKLNQVAKTRDAFPAVARLLSLDRDVLRDILSRLPVKSLIRCTSVCKTWIPIIKSQDLIRKHLIRALNSNDLLLLHTVSGEECKTVLHKTLVKELTEEVYSVRYDAEDLGLYCPIEFPISHKKKLHNSFLRVVGVCDGLVCLADDIFRYGSTFIIWNPCIRKSVTLPSPGVTFRKNGGYDATIGFGFDATTNDYKVVRLVVDQVGSPTIAEVYSLANGSWTSPRPVTPECEIDGAAFQASVNGALHWPAIPRKTVDDLCYFILAFDLGSELFREMPMPESFEWHTSLGLQLSVSGDRKSIALFVMDHRCANYENYFLDIWVMKDYGIYESWTRLIRLGPQGPERRLPRALGFRKSGEVLLSLCGERNHVDGRSPNELGSLDPASREYISTEITGYDYCVVDSYTESLLLLDKVSNKEKEQVML